MGSVPEGMSISDAKLLLAVGEYSVQSASDLPDPLQPLADAVSLALAARTAEVEVIG